MPVELNINASAVVAFTNKLEKLNKTALPVAVRGALNLAAKDMKQTSIQDSAGDAFVQRKPTFFKATSKINFANGYDLNTMQSVVGFTGNSQAIEDLSAQEIGGEIGGRSFIATDAARTGKNRNKLVKPNMRVRALKIVDAKRGKGKNAAARFISSVIFAGKGGNVLAPYKDKTYLWRVNSFKRKGKDWDLKLTKIYTFEKGRKVQIRKVTHFMEKASVVSAKKIDEFFMKEAEKQFNRALQ